MYWLLTQNIHNYLDLLLHKTIYNYEVGANKSSTTYNAKIGLPYVNEYGYAADPSYWAISFT